MAGTAPAAETALDRYVAKPDPNYAYDNYLTKREAGYTAYFLEMTSQQWRSATEVDRPLWKHDVVIVIPQFSIDSSDTAILLITGGDNQGSPPDTVDPVVGAAAVATGAVLVAVRQIPNQPLFSPTIRIAGGKKTPFSATASARRWTPAIRNGRYTWR